MEIVTRRVKSLLKRVNEETPEPFDLFMNHVIQSFLTQNLSEEQTRIVTALLVKEGYMS